MWHYCYIHCAMSRRRKVSELVVCLHFATTHKKSVKQSLIVSCGTKRTHVTSQKPLFCSVFDANDDGERRATVGSCLVVSIESLPCRLSLTDVTPNAMLTLVVHSGGSVCDFVAASTRAKLRHRYCCTFCSYLPTLLLVQFVQETTCCPNQLLPVDITLLLITPASEASRPSDFKDRPSASLESRWGL